MQAMRERYSSTGGKPAAKPDKPKADPARAFMALNAGKAKVNSPPVAFGRPETLSGA